MPILRTVTLTFALSAPLAHSSALAQQATRETVSPLPKPTGKSAVGTAIVYLTDSARRDADFPNGRPINVQLWYPASSSAGPVAPYLADPGLAAAMLRNQYYGVDSAALRAWSLLSTNSRRDVPPAAGKHALIAFSVGLGVSRANYTSIAEELASHGMIVVMVESPLQGFMVVPNGSAEKEVFDSTGRYGETAAHRRGVAAWAKDISFTLDWMSAAQVPAPAAAVAATVDWTRVGATGHSTGGLVALATCESDVRVRVCVDMDGGVAAPDKQPLADFVLSGTTKPTLLLRSQPLYDDTTLARRGITREQWEKRGEAGTQTLAEFILRAGGPIRHASVAGTGHFNFSDAPWVMPSAINRFGGRIIQPRRGWTIITTVLRTYFESEFAGRGNGLDALRARFPELVLR
jgi:dienelactone hydrolase